MDYLLHILILVGIYTILSISLNLISGYTGMISIAHAAFYAVGAYVAALAAINLNSPLVVNMVFAIILSSMLGVIVGLPSLRIRDDYFVLATFAFQVIVYSILNNWISFTGGPMGLPNIPQANILSIGISSNYVFLVLVIVFAVIAMGIIHRMVHSPIGRVLKAIREDEMFAQAMGKNVAFYKMIVFIIGAGMAAMAGVLYAHYMSFIDPTSFTLMESILIISMVIIGGAGSYWGPVIGAICLVLLPELLRFVGLPSSVAANLRQVIYGICLVALMMWRSRGLFGRYGFKTEELT